MANDLTVTKEQAVSTDLLTDFQAFENAQRIGKMLTQSQIVPAAFQNNLPNVMVALEISARNQISPIVVMQNLNIIKGTPRWSSKYLIAAMTTGRVTNFHYEKVSDGKVKVPGFKGTEEIENLKCRAIGTDRKTGEERVGPWVSMEMAVKEGWYGKDGSKWRTMPDIMICYRAASFFANVFYPELSVGMATEDDITESAVMPAHATEIVQSSEIITPAEEAPAKPKRAKKSAAPVKEETTTDTDSTIEADFSEVPAENNESEKPAPVVLPQRDNSTEWNNWGE